MTAPDRVEHVVIVGGGLGGLAAALALLRHGFRATVLEQASTLGEVGAGVQLSANATRVLRLLGLEEAVRQFGAEPAGKVIRHWNTGRAWPVPDLATGSREKYGDPFAFFHRADLHAALERCVRAADASAIRLASRGESIDASGRRPAVVLDNGERVEGDLIVGADGVHSRVRISIAGPDTPKFTGLYAWRGIISTADLPEHLRAVVGTNWIGPGRHVVQYPLRRGELMNFVGIVEGNGWQVESWTQQGSLEDCLKDFAGWHEDVQTMIRMVKVHYKWAFMGREPLQHWTSGRVTLLGDAAHPTRPFLAQGAAMAMEDGYVLARALAAHRESIDQALASYGTARVERTSAIVRGSNENTARFHNPQLKDPVTAAAYIDDQWTPEKVRQRYEWLFDYKVDQVPV
jgi:salicylate hydroxylase